MTGLKERSKGVLESEPGRNTQSPSNLTSLLLGLMIIRFRVKGVCGPGRGKDRGTYEGRGTLVELESILEVTVRDFVPRRGPHTGREADHRRYRCGVT